MQDILDNINGYQLDNQQKEVVLNENLTCLVAAGAGSGKSLTIVGKIRYLIEVKKINPQDIICISFTNDSVASLQNNITKNYHYDVSVKTFHKLALEIIRNYQSKVFIAPTNLLEYTIDEYFESLDEDILLKKILTYFDYFSFRQNRFKNYQKIIKTKEFIIFKKKISRFLHLYKSNYSDFYQFENYLNKNKGFINWKIKRKNKIFLLFAFNIYQLYQSELKSQNMLDFDDMLHQATEIVNKKGYFRKCEYLIIDEYQDTSYVRFKLIKRILEKTKAKLLVVGDDFQSIYRFTGCDLTIFTDFKNYFPNSKILKIENTYRNSQQLIDIAGSFIMKNPSQIKKSLKSTKNLEKPIVIKYYQNIKFCLKKLILEIYNNYQGDFLLLGRNNKDINLILGNDFLLQKNGYIVFKNHEEINIRFLTVHKSKGLESDHVIIINNLDDLLGFPSQILDDKVLKYVTFQKDNFPYSEERRLFYVALTRTKNKTYLLVKKNKESIFVKELIKNYNSQIEIIK